MLVIPAIGNTSVVLFDEMPSYGRFAAYSYAERQLVDNFEMENSLSNSCEAKVVNAICYKCGEEKSAAIMLCEGCRALPTTKEERILSVCLSDKCIREENLVKSMSYIKKKKRPPGFHEKVMSKAIRIVNKMPDHIDMSGSIELSASFFREDLITDD